MNKLNKTFGFMDLSMGMSSDFLLATKHSSTFVRVGSSIFGQDFNKFLFLFFLINLSIIKKSFPLKQYILQ